MKSKILALSLGLLSVLSFTACGADPEAAKFKTEIDHFCTSISEIDTAINNLDADSEAAIEELLIYLDKLDSDFQGFAELDFPEEFDYLESLADESSAYMTEAVKSYHEAYGNNSYNEYTAEYAKENYSRAYKRVQVIITFLHGEEPEDVDLTVTTDADDTTASEAVQ
ncbi:MAG: hypothetical protein E7291_02305 [Lachnospiraceae bacterium]|nr:hypothetical protein [Lachnospiraceae bacterium]